MKYKISRIRLKIAIGIGLILISLPVAFITSMYLVSRGTGFEGPRGGPQDAFRHTYTSALVARYLSPRFVRIATHILERNPKSSYDLMDIHNNNLGIQIALDNLNNIIITDQKNIYLTVYDKVKNAEVETKDKNTVRILESSKWQRSDLF